MKDSIQDIQKYISKEEMEKIYKDMRDNFIQKLPGSERVQAVDYALQILNCGPFNEDYAAQLLRLEEQAMNSKMEYDAVCKHAEEVKDLFDAAFDYLRDCGESSYIGSLQDQIYNQIIEPINLQVGAARMVASEFNTDLIHSKMAMCYVSTRIKACVESMKDAEWVRIKPIMRNLRRLCNQYLNSKFFMTENDANLRDFSKANLLVQILWITSSGALNDKRGFNDLLKKSKTKAEE